MRTLLLGILLSFFMAPAFGLEGPANINFNGNLVDSSTGNPIAGPVTVKFQIYDPSAACLLFEESHTNINPNATTGAVSIKVGTGTRAASSVDGGLSWRGIFSNKGTLRAASSTNCAAGYSPSDLDGRALRVWVGSTALSPDYSLTSVPFASQADSVQGYVPSDFVMTSGNAQITGYIKMAGTNEIRFADSGNTNYVGFKAPTSVTSTRIWTLPAADGSSGQVLKTDGAGALSWMTPSQSATSLQGFSVSSATPSSNQILAWNSSSNSWVPKTLSSGTVTAIAAGTGLIGGTITSSGSLAVNVGTGANQIVQLNGSAQLPAVSGANLTNINASTIGGYSIAASAPAVGQVLTWNGLAWAPAAASGSSQWTTSGSDIYFASGRVGVGTTTPTAGAVLDVRGSGTSASAMLIPRDTTSNRPAGVPGMIRYNTSLSKFEAFEGSGWTNMIVTGTGGGSGDAVTLQSRTLASTAPANGQVIGWNSSLSQWEPQTVSSSSTNATQLQSRNVSTISPTVNQVLGWNGGAWLPMTISGTGGGSGDAVTLQSRSVSATVPTVNQVLGWNGLAWTPMTISGTGGTSNATQLQSRIVSSTAPTVNQVLGWNGLAWLPMTISGTGGGSGDAVTLQSRNLASTAPVNGQVIGWNSSFNQWEPLTVTSSSTNATQLQSRNVSTVTPTVNQVLGWNGGAWLPMTISGTGGGSGDAVTLQSRTLASTAPSNGQMIGWNSSLNQWEPQTVTASSANATQLQSRSVSTTAPTVNQVLGWNGLAWLPMTIAGTGGGSSQWTTSGSNIYYSSGAVSIGTFGITSGSIFEVRGTGTVASSMIIPRDTTSSRPSGIPGMIRYNTTTAKFEGYESSGWGNLIPNSEPNHGTEMFTTSTSWTVPSGITYAKVIVIGGGGGTCSVASSYHGGTGAAGVAYVNSLSPGASVTITVGTAGTTGNPGSAGNTSSFGAHISSTGGSGCSTVSAGTDGTLTLGSAPQVKGYQNQTMTTLFGGAGTEGADGIVVIEY